MKEISKNIKLKCLFCGLALKGPQDSTFSSGDQITCTSCGESNDFDSVMSVAIEEGRGQIVETAQREIAKQLKGLFKKR